MEYSDISKIQKNSQIQIEEIKYDALGMVKYNTTELPTDTYIKIFLNDHYVLVIMPEKIDCILGVDKGNILVGFPTPDTFNYHGKTFNKVGEENQRVVLVFFGEEDKIERNVKFIDYEDEKNENSISIGLLDDGTRADVIGKSLNLKQIKIIS